jgi:hypothetical protein
MRRANHQGLSPDEEGHRPSALPRLRRVRIWPGLAGLGLLTMAGFLARNLPSLLAVVSLCWAVVALAITLDPTQ